MAVTAEVSLVPEGRGYGLATTLRIELPEHLTGRIGTDLVEATHQTCPSSKATRATMPITLVVE